MSKSIEERVVQMKFENGQFEKGVETSINTMNSLKKSMNFEDAVKGFQKLDDSAKSVDMSGLGKAVETVRVKFTLLDRIAIQVLDRIANKVINLGETMVRSLSTDQISAGWDKFGQKTSAVQTIMAATASKFNDTATQMATVNEQLDKLNWFTDETSYNFLDMVNNIGKFTSNNIDLETSVTAMQGISNWAAISGATINEAGRAMYNLSQAVATGSVKLIDWKSIENANMATAEFKKTAVETAAELGTLKKIGEDTFQTIDGKVEISTTTFSGFNDSLQKAWFSSDVLLKTLDRYGAATNKLNEIYTELDENVTTSDIISAIDDYSDALSKARTESEKLGLSEETTMKKAEEAGLEVAQEVADAWGITLEQATEWLSAFDNEVMQFGLKSFKAAQEAKTLTDAIEATKDAVSTGWMKSFELVFGDYLEAKELWTDVANQLYDLFAGTTSARNTMLAQWKKMGGHQYLVDIIVGLLQSLNNLKEAALAGVKLVFGELDADKLLDWTKAFHQFILDATPGPEVLVAFEKAVAAVLVPVDILKTLLIGGVNTAIRIFNALMGESKLNLVGFVSNAADAVLAFHQWFKTSTLLTDAVDKLVDRIVWMRTAVTTFIDVVRNLPIVQTFVAGFRDIWQSASENIAEYLKNMKTRLGEFYDWVKKLPRIKTLDDLKLVFKTLYDSVIVYAVDIRKHFPKVVVAFNNLISSVIATMGPLGQSISAFLEAPLTFLKDMLFHLIGELKEFVLGIKAVDIAIVAVAGGIWIALSNIAKIFESVGGAIGKFQSILKGFGTSFSKWTKAKSIKEYAKAIMYLAIALRMVADIEAEKAWMAVALIVALGAAVIGLAKAMDYIKGGKLATATFAAIGLSVLAIVASLKMLSTIDTAQMDKDLVIMAGLIAGLGAVSIALTKFAPSFQSMGITILAFSAGIFLLVSSLKSLGKLDPTSLEVGLFGLIGLMGSLAIAMRIMTKTMSAGNVSAIAGGGSILAFAVGIKLIVSALKSLTKLNPSEAMTAIVEITALMTALAVAMRIMNGIGGSTGKFKAGSTFLGLAVALNLLVPAIKGLSKIGDSELKKAKNVILQLGVIFVAAVGLSSLGGKNASKAGFMLIEMAAAITILTVAVRALGSIDDKVLAKGVTAVTVIGLMFTAAIAASSTTDKTAKGALQAMVAAIALLAWSVWELSKLPMDQLIASAGSMTVMIASIGASMRLISGMKTDVKTIASLGVMIFIIGEIAYLITKMTQLGDMSQAINAAGAIGIVLGGLAASMRILSGSKGVDKSVLADIAVLSLIAAAFGGVLLAMVQYFPNAEVNKVIGIVVALDLLIPMLTGCMLLLDKIKSAPNKTTMKKFEDMAIMFGVIGASLYGITAAFPGGDISTVLGIVAAIDLLLPVMTACMYGLSMIKKGPTAATMTAFTQFAYVAGVFGGALAVISVIPELDVTKAIGIAAAIDLLVPVLVACFAALDKLGSGTVETNTLASLAAFGTIAAALGAAIGAFATYADIDIDRTIKFVLAVDALLAVLTPCFLAINKVGVISPNAIASATIAGVAIDAIGLLLSALVAIIGYFPEDILRKGATNGALIGQAIGGFIGGAIGGLIGGTIEAIIKILPAFGTALSDFITNATGFLDGLSGIDPSSVAKAGALVGVILALTAADFLLAVESLATGVIGKITSIFGLNTDFKTKMQTMGEAINAFAVACGDVDPTKVKTAAEAAMLLTNLESSVPPVGGALQSFLGQSDLSSFGQRLEEFGVYLSTFVETVKDITDGDVKGAAAAASAMAEVERNLPAYGGVLQEWFGQQDIAAFGERLVSFGGSLSEYAGKVTGITKKSVSGSADAGKILADLESNLVFSGGFVTNFLFGSQDIGAFGERLKTFGQSLLTYAVLVQDITGNSVKGSAEAIGILSEMEKSLDTTGGAKSFWFGDSSFSKFSENLSALGYALKAYDENIKDVNTYKITNSNNAVKALVDLAAEVKESKDWAKDLVNTINGIIEYFLTELKTKQTTIQKQGEQIIQWLVLGFGMGFTKYHKMAYNYGVAIANKIRDGVEKTLEIASPSAVMEEDGHWVVKGLAEGIDKDTSAEDAAAKKASNIEAAFKKIFEASSRLATKYTTDYELWTLTEGKDADELTKIAKEYELGIRELKRLADESKHYMAVMETYRKTFGEDSQEFLDAQNKYNQSLIDMYKQRDKVDEIAKRQLTLNKPSATMVKTGEWLIDSLAYGISSDMSAEEAAAQKVQNIADAFQSEFDKIDLARETDDTEYELWKATEGFLASESLTKTKEYEYGINELQRLANTVQLRNAEMEATRKVFGENSQQFVEAENAYKQALTAMYNQKNDLDTMAGQIIQKDRNQIARDYAAYRKEAAEIAEMMGWTIQEQEDYAARMVGFDGQAAFANAMETNNFDQLNTSRTKEIVEAALAPVSAQIVETTATTFEEACKTGLASIDLSGLEMGDAFDVSSILEAAFDQQDVKIEELASKTSEKTAKAISKGVSGGIKKGLEDVASDVGTGGEDIGKNAVSGINNAIDAGITSIRDKAESAGEGILDAMKTKLQIKSPSRATYEIGDYTTQGLINGLTAKMQNVFSAAQQIGAQVGRGLQQGIQTAGQQALAAAQALAAQVSSVMQAALGVHSPSKVADEIGQYVGIGLANGLNKSIAYVNEASENLVDGPTDALASIKDQISDILNADDDQFVLTPVLDMDTLREQARSINGVLNSNGRLNVTGANLQAGFIADRTARNAIQNGTQLAKKETITNYNYTQNNYSPKALSQADIYRQTKNQFSQLKGATQR